MWSDIPGRLRIHLELSIHAWSILLARQAGIEIPLEEDVEDNLRVLQSLEKAIGRTGHVAIDRLLQTSSHDLRQLDLLEQARVEAQRRTVPEGWHGAAPGRTRETR